MIVPGGGSFRRCEGRLWSGAPPPPAARSLGRLSGSATNQTCCGRGCAGVGGQHCPGGLHALWGLARRGGGGGSLGSGALPFQAARPLGGLPGPTDHVLWARVWVCATCVVSCAMRASVRCAASRLSPWCPPLWCLVAVLCSSCACCSPFPARVPRLAARYLLFLSWFITLSSTLRWPALLPCMHFFPASALVFVSVFLLACFLGPCSGILIFLSCWVL